MKKKSTILTISGTIFIFSLLFQKIQFNQNKDTTSNNINIEANQNKTQTQEFENQNNQIDDKDKLDTNSNNTTNKDKLDTDNNDKNEIQVENSENEIESITSLGIFEGFADDNFVEIRNNNNYNVFKVEDEEIKNILRNKDIGTEINFKYIENENSKIIEILN